MIDLIKGNSFWCPVQIWCHPTSNPWAAPLTLNNETSLSPRRQHQWWFYWHMERSHSWEPCGQKLQLIWIKYIIKPTFEEATLPFLPWLFQKSQCCLMRHQGAFICSNYQNKASKLDKIPKERQEETPTSPSPRTHLWPVCHGLADAFNGSYESLWFCGSG